MAPVTVYMKGAGNVANHPSSHPEYRKGFYDAQDGEPLPPNASHLHKTGWDRFHQCVEIEKNSRAKKPLERDPDWNGDPLPYSLAYYRYYRG